VVGSCRRRQRLGLLRIVGRVRDILLLMAVANLDRQPVASRAVWRAADTADADAWTYRFSADERTEIVYAAERAASLGLTTATLTADQFELPGLTEQIGGWVEQLNHGRGFLLLRGFPTDVLSSADTELAYVGLGLHLGTPVSQNAHGDLLGHVVDEGVARQSPAVRLYRTNQRQDFHTDGADLVGLLCLHGAKAGGESRIASSYAVYNEMLARRPDLVDTLYEPLYWDRNDEQGDDEPAFYPLPVFTDIHGTPRIFYIGWYIRDAQRHPDAPRLTDAQRDAMNMLEAVANDPEFYVEMDFQPGDIQLLNNAKILHSREAYQDHDDPDLRRHLLRLWLVAHDFSSVEDTLRQGIPPRQPK
jgi:hypothetical protein